MAKLIPNRGAWLEFETSKRDVISVKVDRKRKMPVTVLLRADRLRLRRRDPASCSPRSTTTPEHRVHRDDPGTRPDPHGQPIGLGQGRRRALLEFYKKLRPGDPPTLDNAKSFMQNLLFTPRRYDLGKVGRYKLNRRLDLDVPLTHRTLTNDDLVAVVRAHDPDQQRRRGRRTTSTTWATAASRPWAS